MKANVKCTVSLFFFFSFSFKSDLFFSPSISMQNEEVKAVSAPSALGNNADIKAIINIMLMAGGKKFIATEGNILSPITFIVCPAL